MDKRRFRTRKRIGMKRGGIKFGSMYVPWFYGNPRLSSNVTVQVPTMRVVMCVHIFEDSEIHPSVPRWVDNYRWNRPEMGRRGRRHWAVGTDQWYETEVDPCLSESGMHTSVENREKRQKKERKKREKKKKKILTCLKRSDRLFFFVCIQMHVLLIACLMHGTSKSARAKQRKQRNKNALFSFSCIILAVGFRNLFFTWNPTAKP